MPNIRIRSVAQFLALGIVILSNCGFSCGPLLPPTGFTIETNDLVVPLGYNPSKPTGPITRIPRLFTNVYGSMELGTQASNAKGNIAGYSGNTGTNGFLVATNMIVPADYDHYAVLGPTVNPLEPCIFPTYSPDNSSVNLGNGLFMIHDAPTANNETYEWQCIFQTPSQGAIAQFALQNTLPTTLTLGANGMAFTSNAGYPQMFLFGEDLNGNPMSTSLTATTVSSDGSQATFPFPTSPTGTMLNPSIYKVALANANLDGTLSPAGPALLSIGKLLPFNQPMGVAPQVVQASSYSSVTEDSYGDGTCVGGTTYSSATSSSAYPIVAEYSSRAVDNSGNLIAVGARPTALVAYHQIDQSQYNTDGPCSYYGQDVISMGNAIVANSGDNTVSVIDLTQNIVIATIPVGLNPNAIALSSDESVAYILNAGDGSISLVNLSTYVQTSKVAVGSGVQSIAFTPDGHFWVGGQGFLAELSPNLSLEGTYSTNGLTLTSLGYSVGGGEIVATAVDGAGNLSIQEVNLQSTVSTAAFVVNASRQIAILPSTNGTPYFSQTMQSSAMPLSMPQGTDASYEWLSVSGNLSGFSITDTVGHAQFMSGSAPGPITSIAIDPSQYVAYLALPDNNSIMEVYLPNPN